MDGIFARTALLLGDGAIERLKKAKVAVFGIGGVGGYTAEALVRSGVGTVELIDNDTVSETNINRQLFATVETVGQLKVNVAEKRLKAINPEVNIICRNMFLLPENIGEFDFKAYDYVVDAIDTVKSKLALAERCYAVGTPIISSMGAGNKLDATAFTVTDIFKTSVCPLARVMRTELKKRGVKKLKVVYSEEKPIKPKKSDEVLPDGSKRRQIPGSVAFVPPVAGLICAGEVIKDLVADVGGENE